MLEYVVDANRLDERHAAATCKDATIEIDTDPAGRRDLFNPAELLLAALAACMLKGIERVAPMLKFSLRGARLHLHAVRQDDPPRLVAIEYELIIDSDEPDRRLELLHRNAVKYGTISNTLASAVSITGRVRRGAARGA
ncbi:MAG TPA: OsmC family protein [Devosiaceae bacterium]|jgi:uncharacterized OsmC-like protein|nr:OsmC family protein [Devosiaceae bacterium]